MPYKDGTGPMGQGPMTGRGMGPCGRGAGFGRGRGFGRGMGYRCAYPITLSKEEQKKILEAELEDIETEKKEIQKRLEELE